MQSVDPASELVREIADGTGDPLCVVLAGSNGAGKTTYFRIAIEPLGVAFVNADEIAQRLRSQGQSISDLQAAELAETERRLLIQARKTFCMETVLSDTVGRKLALFDDIRKAGYRLMLLFIGIPGPALSQARVATRVLEGGHDVPLERIVERYPRTLNNLRQALPTFHRSFLIDNSSRDAPYRLVALTRGRGRTQHGHKFEVVWRAPAMPAWAAFALDEKSSVLKPKPARHSARARTGRKP